MSTEVNPRKLRILLVEDEAGIRAFLRSTLNVSGYQVIEAVTAREGILQATRFKPDLSIIDLGLPDFSGKEIVSAIRQWSRSPIIILSAAAEEYEKVRLLDAGANDYITKPFGVEELLARIRATIRNHHLSQEGKSKIQLGQVLVDLEKRNVLKNGIPLHLTPTEFRILSCLCAYLGSVVTHKQLLNEIWGPSHVTHTHYLRIYMKQLRTKIENDPVRPDYLLTETGVGYRLVSDNDYIRNKTN